MIHSEDPDPLASDLKKPTDLDLQCLQRQGILGGKLEYKISNILIQVSDLLDIWDKGYFIYCTRYLIYFSML